MADKRITNLPFKTDPTLSDEMHINDVVSNFDKKVLLSVLRTLLSIPYMQVSLSNYDNDSAPAVKQGSSFDSKGIPIDIESDLTPSGYAGISNSTTFYLYWDKSTGSFIYSETIPTWLDLYQGWYTGDDRALFSMYKDSGGTLYQNKSKLQNVSMIQGTKINTAVVPFSTTSSYDIPAIPAGKQFAIFKYSGQNTSGGLIIRSLNLPSGGRYGFSYSAGAEASTTSVTLTQHGAGDSSAGGFDFMQFAVDAGEYLTVIVSYTRLP